MGSYLLAPLLLMVVLLQDHCDATAGSDESSIPMLASGKRQHNIMRFGKRPAGGHSLIHFGKREEGGSGSSNPPKHSFLYFGKREVPDLLDYLQKNRDGSYKRGHTIMRFGKRGGPDNTHSFIRFGRAPNEDDDGTDYDSDKRAATGHSMMYFGKRAGHSMMYFGKRDGLDDKRAHAMIHFGKRGDDWEDTKRGGGGAHSMIHFGKRVPEDDEDEAEWSPEAIEELESKRGGGAHSMIHFGKRGPEEEDVDWSPEETKRQHNLLRFGKKMDRKGSHAMIHFGKRETGEDKRAHAMIHFGKRGDGALANQSVGPLNRMKRDVSEHNPLITLVRYDGAEEIPPTQDEPPREGPNSYFRPDEMWSPLYHQDKEWEPDYVEYNNQPDKKDGGSSKNVFLRFG